MGERICTCRAAISTSNDRVPTHGLGAGGCRGRGIVLDATHRQNQT